MCLHEALTNNEVEHEALISGLQMALEMDIKCIKVYRDSQLVVRQVLSDYAAVMKFKEKFYLPCRSHEV